MKIQQFKYEKVEIDSKEWELPTEPSYYFQTHVRRSISVVPYWTSWQVKNMNKPEEIYELKIVCVYQSFEAKIEAFNIRVSSIAELYHKEKGNLHEIVAFLVDWSHECTRTKEQFDSDFNRCLDSIKERLES